MNSFVKANPNRCIGCRTCLIACVVAHEGMEIFESDPYDYNFHPKLFLVKTAAVTAPVQCKHCETPACLTACTAGAIAVTQGNVTIDERKCIGCKGCVAACPFGVVELVGTKELQADGSARVVANKCDLCAGLPDGQACVRVCPTDALELVTEDALEQSIQDKRTRATF